LNAVVRFVVAALAVALIFGQVGAVRAADEPPYVLNGIFSQTGPAAFVGSAQMKTLVLLESIVNKQGGIHGRPIKFEFADDQSSPQIALQIVTRLVAEKAPIIFGPSVVPTCAAAMSLVARSGPLLWCFSPAIFPPPNSYVFSAGPTIDAAGLALVRFMRNHGWKRLAAISSNDGSGQAFDHAINFALAQPENKDVQMLVYEHMNPADISVAAQMARIKAANPQAVLTLATGSPWGTIMRGLNDAGIDVPVGGGHGNAVYSELTQYRSFLPRELYFPGLAALAPNSIGRGPVAEAQKPFFAAFEEAGIKPDIGLTTAWDPGLIVIDALRKLGPSATAQQLREEILNLHGWVGINGVYDFSDGLQRGLTVQAIVIDRWDKTKDAFVAVSRPGGYPR
jgi:branched-chain amino acid transport system substrate-binding protein